MWRALSDDNGARAPVPGDYFRGDGGVLVSLGASGAMCGAVAWGVALVAAEWATRRRLREGSSAGAVLAAATDAATAATSPFVVAERERVERFARRASTGSFGDDVGDARDAPTFAFAACGVSAPRLSEFGDDRESSRDARAGGAANVWFGVEPGEIVCVVGSRDSGKETLARCAAGMDPFAGDALFANGAASARTGGVAALAAAGVGACLRDDAFVDETATPVEHLALVAAFRGARHPARVARDVAASAGLFETLEGVEGDPNGSPNGESSSTLAETPLCALDASTRRRVALASATVGDPAVLIFDAPTRAVDSSARRRVWRRLADHARRGGAVLASTDAVDEAEALASRVVAMANGRVIDVGAPRELKARHGAAYALKVQLRGDGRDGSDASSNPASREDAEATHALVASAAPAAAGTRGSGTARGNVGMNSRRCVCRNSPGCAPRSTPPRDRSSRGTRSVNPRSRRHSFTSPRDERRARSRRERRTRRGEGSRRADDETREGRRGEEPSRRPRRVRSVAKTSVGSRAAKTSVGLSIVRRAYDASYRRLEKYFSKKIPDPSRLVAQSLSRRVPDPDASELPDRSLVHDRSES